ncbi:MAG: SMP-30/gluconolactonase/LRE family protein [Halioglobus sp.]
MPRAFLQFCLSGFAIILTACSAGEVNESCEPMGPITPVCGAIMPEDLEPLAPNGGILVSEYGDGGKTSGALSWLNPASERPFARLVDSASVTQHSNDENWGDPACTPPPTLSPHGIHLQQRADKEQLLVVNHSDKEQVLFYEVIRSAAPNDAPELQWRGCVTFPEYAVLNDVAALPDGGFAVTHMYDRTISGIAEIGSMLGINKGHVWRWTPGSEPRVIEGSEARMPNGIEVAADGKSLWVNNYIEQELRQFDVSSEKILSRIEVPNIDNSAWLPDGRLLLASHVSPISMSSCFGLEKGSCGSPYELIAVDTQTGKATTLYTSAKGEPFGPATVAVPYQGKLYAGSFSGDRVAAIDIPF